MKLRSVAFNKTNLPQSSRPGTRPIQQTRGNIDANAFSLRPDPVRELQHGLTGPAADIDDDIRLSRRERVYGAQPEWRKLEVHKVRDVQLSLRRNCVGAK